MILFSFLFQIFEVQNTLPESDIYVTESLNPVIRTNTNPVQHGALELIAQLQSMLCVALSQPGRCIWY